MYILTLAPVEVTAFNIVIEPGVQDYCACYEYGGGSWKSMDELMGFQHEDLSAASIVLSDEAAELLMDLIIDKKQELAQLEATSPVLYALAHKLTRSTYLK